MSRNVAAPSEEGPTPLGDAIAAEMLRRSHTQHDVARLLDTNQQTVGRWIDGRIRRPGDAYLPAMAEYLGVSEGEVRELRERAGRPDPRERATVKARVAALERQVEQMLDRLEQLLRRLDALDE